MEPIGWYLPPVVCISVSVSAVLFVGQSVTDIRSAPTAQHGKTPLPSPESVSAPQREFLSVEHVTVDFSDAEGGNHHALADVDFRLPEGGRLALVGHTGSGKSVLLMALLRLLPENASFHGRVYYRGTNLFGLSEKEMARLRGRELAYVPQGAGNAMNPMLSVGFQIAESARIHRGMGRREAFDEAVSLLRAMGIENPEKRAKDYPHRYSGGMMQRALLGTALACGSGFFLVDEPTKGLDPAGREEVFRSLARLDTQTILLVTHDLEFAERFAIMWRSCMRRELWSRLPKKRSSRVRCIPIPRRCWRLSPNGGSRFRCECVPSKRRTMGLPVRFSRGATRRFLFVRPCRPWWNVPDVSFGVGGMVLQARNLHKSFSVNWWKRRALPVLKGADLSVARGETVGIVGSSGRGKTTLALILCGLMDFDAGGDRLSGGEHSKRQPQGLEASTKSYPDRLAAS